MAEFALGLTKTAVEGTLSLVKSAVEEEEKLRDKVQNDMVFISGELEMVHSFLRVANNRERARSDQVVLTSVRQLRTLAFDVEDCIEYVLHLDLNSRWAWLRRAWQKVYCCAPPLPLDTAIAEIKQLKVRVEDVSQRNTRYSHTLRDTTAEPAAIAMMMPAAGATYYASSACFHLLRDAWEATGKWRRNTDTGNLQQELLVGREFEGDDLQVISVWGSNANDAADVGMASILTKAYCDPNIRETFKIRAWVKLMHPFNQEEFSRSLLTQFYPKKTTHQHQAKAADQVAEDQVMMQQQMRKQRYLLVLEDVFTVAEWDVIRTYLPDDNTKGSRILLSTPHLGIALQCTGKPYQVSELTQFSRDKFLCAFFRKMPSNLDDFKCQLRRGGVISVWGPHKSNLIHILYKCIINRKEEFDGVEFERHSWVNVRDTPFHLDAFARDLYLSFCSDDNEITEVAGKLGHQGLIKRCCDFLSKEECLVVIDGLQSIGDWDLIKSKFLSSNPPPKGCILVVTNAETVATHCVKDPDYQALNIKDLEADTTIVTLINKEKEPLFYSRRKKSTESNKKVELVGRWAEWDGLHRLVFRHPDVVSVWGIAGVGKSILVREYYYKLMPRGQFISFGWVDVPHPFNLTELSARLLLNLHSNDPQAKEAAAVSMMEGQDPIQECSKFLRGRKCLVVIDGLRSMQDWDLIRATFLSVTIPSTIVVITNDAKVAMHCVENNKGQVLNIRRLKADAPLDLLMKKIAWKDKKETSEEMTKLVKSVVAKCGGLPKVIAAIGEVCSSDIGFLKSLNVNFMGTLEMEPKFHGLRPLFSWIQSYFDACSDSLKPCIFYLSIFSAEKNIRLRRLLWRWVAEGYCRDTSDGTYEENWENFISELVSLSIVQKSPINKVFCQINGFFHEYIISRPMEDNLVFALEGHCRLNSQRAGQHLTIRSSWDRKHRIVYESIDFSRLRSLTVSGKWESFFVSKKVNMKLLRVLDLEDATDVSNEDLNQIVKVLRRLKYLSLRGHTKITCLPSSVGGLMQLETLDIRRTSIATLPLAITKLHNLRYIRAGTTQVWDWEGEEDRALSSAQAVTNLPPAAAATPAPTEGDTDRTAPVLPKDAAGSSVLVMCNNRQCTPNLASSLLSKLWRHSGRGVKVPANIGNLSALDTLGVVKVNGQCSKAIFGELKKLTQLCKLGVSGINKRNIYQFCDAISGLVHLKSLSVEVDKIDNLDDIPEPPKTLNSLKLHGRVHKLLVWIEQLHSLKKLKLDLTIANPQELKDLRLSKPHVLHHLCITQIEDGEVWIGEQLCARVIEIHCSSVLHLSFDDVPAFPAKNIEVLKVHFSGCSGWSSEEISGLSKLRSLKEVWLKGYTEAHKQYMDREIRKMNLLPGQERPVLKLV